MHITDIMRRESPTFSFEFFPPKTPAAAESLYQTIRELEDYMPHFVSVTYGAGGSTRDLTHDLVDRIKTTTKLDPIPHLTLGHRECLRSGGIRVDAGPRLQGRHDCIRLVRGFRQLVCKRESIRGLA